MDEALLQSRCVETLWVRVEASLRSRKVNEVKQMAAEIAQAEANADAYFRDHVLPSLNSEDLPQTVTVTGNELQEESFRLRLLAHAAALENEGRKLIEGAERMRSIVVHNKPQDTDADLLLAPVYSDFYDVLEGPE